MKSLLIAIISLLFHSQLQAQIYHYINDKGRKIYVDRLSQVPPKYQDQLQKKTLKKTAITPVQQQKYDSENAQLANKMRARNARAKLTQALQKMKTKVQISHNKVVVPVAINYAGRKREINLLLDTGASSTVINLAAIPEFERKNARTSYAQVAGGGLIKTWRITLNKLAFGPISFSKKPVYMIDHKGHASSQGLLGMDVLSKLEYRIDFNTQHIIWNEHDYLKVQQKISEIDAYLK